MTKTSKISWDWKEQPTIEELSKALNPLGVYVYEDPDTADSDEVGYVFSNKELTSSELKNIK